MPSNQSNPEIVAKLDEIIRTLARHEVMLRTLSGGVQEARTDGERTNEAEMELFLMKLSKLTLKRHAVLTATLGHKSYQQIADLMGCDTTTVKLHLRNALQLLGIPSRSILQASHADMLKPIEDKVYRTRFGISKTWWLDADPSTMEVLRSTKPTANQHTKEKGNAEAD